MRGCWGSLNTPVVILEGGTKVIVRIYTGSDGESHFEDIDLKYEASGNSASAPPEQPESMTFRTQQPGVDLDFHPAPRRQYIVSLSGQVEVGLGNGEKRIFKAGDVMLADDTTGRGHTTRVVGNEPRVSIVIPV